VPFGGRLVVGLRVVFCFFVAMLILLGSGRGDAAVEAPTLVPAEKCSDWIGSPG